ncbi:MAG TPA: carbohydrate kinase family protein [Candidatus Acidoferrales bacterium]|nr:carbohydrate kinase family protein [Candidatus Acidoferrales bacterium]
MMTPASARSDRGMVVFGEFFFDLVFYNLPRVPRMGEEVKTASFARFPGGGLATTALVAARLGTKVTAITRVGRDALVNPEWQRLIQSGISTQGSEFDLHLPTAITVCAAYEGDRMMITDDRINAKMEKLLAHSGVQEQLRRAGHVHMACALRPPHVWMTVIRKLRKRVTVSVDLGWNLDVLASPLLPSLLKEFEFTFPNEPEAMAMTGEKTVEAAARKLARWVRVPVVKLGPDGSLAVRQGKIVRVKSIRVRAVDATGSGDAFNGGFLHGYLAGWPLEDCLRAGNICGALATTGAGGSCAIPTQERLKKLMKKLR